MTSLRRLAACGLKAWLYARCRGRSNGSLRVLEYHYVDDSGSPLSVSPSQLRRHFEVLRDGGWRTLRASDVVARATGDAKNAAFPGGGEVWLTFDDGHESFAKYVAPLLIEFGFTATVFVVPEMVGRSPAWYERDAEKIDRLLSNFAFSTAEREALARDRRQRTRERLMDWNQLRQLSAQGVCVESHSQRHCFLTTLSDEALVDDLRRSREQLRDELEVDSRVVCYPYGDHDDRVIAAARNAGYVVGVTSGSDKAIGETDPMRTPRTPLGGRSAGAMAAKFALSSAADDWRRWRA